MKNRSPLTALVLSLLFLLSCRPSSPETVKMLSSDPFAKTITASQIFEIDAKDDNTIEGDNGTVILLPKGCFKNSSNEIVIGRVKIELTETLSVAGMLLSNMTTTSNGRLLETGGMLYFNATLNGEQLIVNKENPIHVEVPTSEVKPGMMAYRGIRDEHGTMNWVDPQPLDNCLQAIDINTLDFLPPRFRDAVEFGMPFKKYKTATDELTDSLYYSLSAESDLTAGLESTAVNEPHDLANKAIKNGRYTKESYKTQKLRKSRGLEDAPDYSAACGIDPAIIKTIKSEKFENTIIATREFQERLRILFQNGDHEALEVYIKNADKNLYELDSMAANVCEKNKLYNGYHALMEMAKQKRTRVCHDNVNTEKLKHYYEKQFKKTKAELEKNRDAVMKALQQKNKEAEKVIASYRKVLWKREKQRMQTYGFTWTNTGWINIDNGTLPKDFSRQTLEVKVVNGKQFDRVYPYVLYLSIESMYRLNSTDSINFYVGDADDKAMLMPNSEDAVLITIGYEGEKPSFDITSFDTGSDKKLSVTLKPTTPEAIKERLQDFERYSVDNKIDHDLSFMKEFYKEKLRQRELQKQEDFMHILRSAAFPKCTEFHETF